LLLEPVALLAGMLLFVVSPHQVVDGSSENKNDNTKDNIGMVEPLINSYNWNPALKSGTPLKSLP